MPRSGPAASTEGRTPGEEQGWKQELLAVSHLAQTLPVRCQSGTPLARRGSQCCCPCSSHLTVLPLAQRDQCWAAAPHCLVQGCRRDSVGSQTCQLWLHRGSSFLALQQPVWHGQEYPSTNPSCPTSEPLWRGGSCASPLSWCKSTSTALTSEQAAPWDVPATKELSKRHFSHLLSPLLVFCLKLKPTPLSQVKEEVGC